MAIRKPLSLASGQLVEISSDWVQAVELASTQTVSTTTLADVVGLTFALQAGKTYIFNFCLLITQATATGIVGVGVNYSGTLTRINLSGVLANSATASTFRVATANNTAMVDNAARAIGGPFPCLVTGTLVTIGAGNLTLRAQRSAGTTTMLLGSGGFVTAV